MRFGVKRSEGPKNEWREKSLATYIEHVLDEKLNSVILSVFVQFFMLVTK